MQNQRKIVMKNNSKKIIEETKDGKFEIGSINSKELIFNANNIQEKSTHLEFEAKTNLHKGAELANTAIQVFEKALIRMNKTEVELVERTRKHVSILKDMANQVGVSISKIEKLTSTDFECKLQRLERLATAIESLEKLNKSGNLASIIKALGHTS